MQCNQVLLSTFYLPNIQYFSKVLSYEKVIIEVQENFQKQSYRNRTAILAANGPLNLIIPVIRPDGNHTPIANVLIDHSGPWQRTHWKAIISAYKNSPFFDFFEPELCHIFTNSEKYLLDWNLLVLEQILKIAGIDKKYSKTEIFDLKWNDDYCDCRNMIHPKNQYNLPDPHFENIPYKQVFSEKFGFISNLSMLDLLFNEGPQAVDICKKSYKL